MLDIRQVLLAALLAGGTLAQTTLYIPGADPQPLTAEALGVGADGATTWLLGPGVSSGTLEDVGIPGPATLVEGPSTAHLIFSLPAAGLALDENCALADGVATCVVVVATGAGDPITVTTTEAVAPFTVQGGGGAGPTSSGAAASVTPSAGSGSGASGASQTAGSSSAAAGSGAPSGSSSSATAAPTQTGNGVARMESGLVASVFTAAMALVALL